MRHIQYGSRFAFLDIGYRSEAEYLDWRAREPVASFESALLAQDIISAAEIAEMQSDIEQEVKAAFDFAEASPFPPAAHAYTDLYQVTCFLRTYK